MLSFFAASQIFTTLLYLRKQYAKSLFRIRRAQMSRNLRMFIRCIYAFNAYPFNAYSFIQSFNHSFIHNKTILRMERFQYTHDSNAWCAFHNACTTRNFLARSTKIHLSAINKHLQDGCQNHSVFKTQGQIEYVAMDNVNLDIDIFAFHFDADIFARICRSTT